MTKKVVQEEWYGVGVEAGNLKRILYGPILKPDGRPGTYNMTVQVLSGFGLRSVWVSKGILDHFGLTNPNEVVDDLFYILTGDEEFYCFGSTLRELVEPLVGDNKARQGLLKLLDNLAAGPVEGDPF